MVMRLIPVRVGAWDIPTSKNRRNDRRQKRMIFSLLERRFLLCLPDCSGKFAFDFNGVFDYSICESGFGFETAEQSLFLIRLCLYRHKHIARLIDCLS